MHPLCRLLILLTLGSVWISVATASCPPEGQTSKSLKALAADGFVVEDSVNRQQLALALAACLEDPDPELRDAIAFSGLSTWLRGNLLESDTIGALRSSLVAKMQGDDDAAGLRHTFAALTLSELARADRIEPVYSDVELNELVDVGASFLQQTDDYRDFDPQLGWRHRVAHGSDLVLQLALNPRVDAAALVRLIDALGRHIAPVGVAYTAGEPQRIARAIYYAHQRSELDAAWWQGWMLRAVPPPADPAAPTTANSLATRHDRIAFLLALHYATTEAANERSLELQTLVNEALQRAL